MSDITINELDVRVIPPVEKHPTIFKTFDALQKDDSFILINDHDPKPLYYQFAAERSGEFSWEYLEKGPDVFRVKLTKIADTETNAERTIPGHHCGKC